MKNVITISREFGSAGRSIGKLVAEKLGFDYYDKEIIERLAVETGFSEKYIEKMGEYAGGTNIFSYGFVGRTQDGRSNEDYLWQTQRKMIEDLAQKGKCVIVGRCADYILKERKDVLNVFIHASVEYRAERIVEVYGETEEKPEKRLRDKDKKRAVNYKYFTDTVWGMARNYHLSLDSGVIGIDQCVDNIVNISNEI